MDFFKKIGKALSGAAGYVGEKNRKTAALNRIRTVIRCEEQAAEKQYLALGRYYYNNLRDKNNSVTEAHCGELEAIEARLDAALLQLEKFYSLEETKTDSLREEIDLEDVQCLEEPPKAQEIPSSLPEEEELLPAQEEAVSAPLQEEAVPAAPSENDDLPFEW